MPLENDFAKAGLYNLKRDKSRMPQVDSRTIPNVTPLVAPSNLDDVEQKDSSMGNLQNLASLSTSLTSGLPAGQMMGKDTTPGQLPGTEFNMGAVNMPGTEQRTPTTSREFDADKFARMAGAFGAAISGPNTWQSRLGATASGLAAENLKEKRDAPRRELQSEYLQARIDSLKGGKDTRTANQKDFEYFQGLSPEKQAAHEKFFGDTKDGRTADQKNLEWYKSLDVDDRKTWEKLYGEKEKDGLDTFEEKEKIKAKYRKKDPDEDLTFEDKEKIKAKYKSTESKDLTPSEIRQRDKMTMDIEHDIADGKATRSDIDLFNKYSKTNYIWTVKKGEKKSSFGVDWLAKDIPEQPKKLEFKAPEDVRKAYKDKIINKEKMNQVLKEHFGESALPQGLAESDIEYNMKTYGKSREEVLAKYLESKGKK